jgi:ornithine lipid hydroxylase
MGARARHRVLAWFAWPLGLVLQVAVVAAVGWRAADAVGGATGLTTVSVLLVLLGLEQALPYRRDWSVRGDREIGRDLGHALLYAGIGGSIAQVAFLSTLPWMLSRLGLARGLGLWPESAPMPLQVLAVVVLGDLLEYWYHRLAHTVSWLWPLHAVHHTPTRLHALKGPRHHLLYYLGRGVLVWTPLVAIGVPPSLVVWQFASVVLVGSLAHANVAFSIPAFAHRLLVTPEFHRIHHSIETREGSSNFATVLPVWDLLFGSHTDPMRVTVRETGIAGDPIPRRFPSELLSPLIWHRLTRPRPGAP